MYELALFAGAGGGILGGLLHGWRTVAAVEIEDYPRRVLLQRQADGILPKFPVWDDIKTFRSDNPECSEFFDAIRNVRDNLVITGGFPCQDISASGTGKGIDGERSGLWVEMFRIICEIRPRFAFVENSPTLTSRGLGRVLGDFSEMGYNARWGVLGACHIGASHVRERIWVLASHICLFNGEGSSQKEIQRIKTLQRLYATRGNQSLAKMSSVFEPKLCRNCNGMDHQMDRLKSIGNGQCPQVVKLAWDILEKRIGG